MLYEAIVIGISAGGMNVMKIMATCLPADFNIPIIVVQHLSPHSNQEWISLLNAKSNLAIKEADEKEKIEKGHVYIAPPNYHLLIERSKTFSLSIDERVSFARPSIDVLFESAAEAYQNKLIGIILTGANNDGTNGMKRVKKYGGLTLVQEPGSAEYACMPASVITEMQVDHILPLNDILNLLIKISDNQTVSKYT